MYKIFIILLFVSISIKAQFIQEINNYESNIFEENIDDENIFSDENNNGGTSPVTPPDDDEFVPINDYLPLLAVAAVGLGFYYRKELNQITK